MNEELRAELEAMAEADQAVRLEAMEVVREHGRESPEYQTVRERGLATDGRHVARLLEIVDGGGWPRRSDVGAAAVRGAFLVLQHARSLDDQVGLLPLVREAVTDGEFDSSLLALLEDRVRVRQDRPQLYGTLCTPGEDGRPRPLPIEDEAHVDQRRAAVGLEPLADYLRRLERGPGG